jgi:amidase
VTAVELAILYLHRVACYDLSGPRLNAFTVLNPFVLDEARASDARREEGKSIGILDGIPYALKDGYKYAGLTVSAGSPAFKSLVANDDCFVAEKVCFDETRWVLGECAVL